MYNFIAILLSTYTISAYGKDIFNQSVSYTPSILSSLYGYDNCIGGVNNFETEKEYFEDLKERNCAVVIGPNGEEITNVPPAQAIRIACRNPHLQWLDGMPVVFNFPLKNTPSNEAIEITLTDGSVVIPDCVTLGPANEENESDTLLLLGHFGDGSLNNIYPAQVSIVQEIMVITPEGEIDTNGLTYRNENDMNYITSSVRLVYSRMWDVSVFSEGNKYPLWPLPSSVYPNTCENLFPSTTHIIRMGFSGGVSLDGVNSILPTTPGIFSVFSAETLEEVFYLGLADLGKTVSVDPTAEYQSDGDNFLDICFDLQSNPEVVADDLIIQLNCDPESGSVLYPPKGFPYGCSPQEIILSDTAAYGYFSKYWIEKRIIS